MTGAIAHLRQTLLKNRNSTRFMVRFGIALITAAYRSVRSAAKFSTDGAYRSQIWVKLFRPRDLHQTTVLTGMNRYPEIFAACREYFDGRPDPRILSYGCATGEEVLTLRQYFPSATIAGAEINPYSLSVCRRHLVDDRIVFLESNPQEIQKLGPFDVIFCLAVLQRTPVRIESENITNLKGIYAFEKFDQKITELDSWLKPEGLLVVQHSQYLVTDASVGPKYQPLAAAKHIRNLGPKFDRRSLRRPDASDNYSIFVKIRS
jgi:hypothetical protein